MSIANNLNTIQIIDCIANQISRYASILLLIFGTIGNLLNLIIFHRPKHQTNPCAVYFFYASIGSLIALYSSLFSRIFASFDADASATFDGLCKIRSFIVWVSTTASSWFVTYATIDRYCISCRDAHCRNWSNLHFTHRSMKITILIASIIFAETFYCYVPNSINTPIKCYGRDLVCRLYNEIVSGLLFVFIPSIIMLTFGLATVTNLRTLVLSITPTMITQNTKRTIKKTDRQLIQMLIVQIILSTIFNIPLAVYRLYSTFTVNQFKDPLRLSIENLFFQVFYLISFMTFGMSFYIYTLTGTVFKNECITLLKSIFPKIQRTIS